MMFTVNISTSSRWQTECRLAPCKNEYYRSFSTSLTRTLAEFVLQNPKIGLDRKFTYWTMARSTVIRSGIGSWEELTI
jgi:hypothetical protein